MAIAEKDELLSSNPELTVSDPNFYSEYETLKQKLDTLMEDWEKATENLENF